MVAPIRSTDGDSTMKLYMHPVSTVCRPIRLLCAENGIKIDEETVDLMTGAHHKEAYASLNPNRQVPLLVDGDLKLTEGSAILKYIAEKYQLPSYPADLKKRAKINEVMDWLNTGFYRDFGYNLVYSRLFPHHKRRSDEAHAGTIAWGKEGSKKWLQLLNDHWIGPQPRLVRLGRLGVKHGLGKPGAEFFAAPVTSACRRLRLAFGAVARAA
jgi:glutathione S-transferase